MKTIKHNGLEWMAQDLDKSMPWQEAMDYCESLGGGWRLPTVKELFAVLDHTKLSPALKIDAPVQSDWYWSSTTYVGYTDLAWLVNLGYGAVSLDNKANTNYVWPVRDAK